MLAEQEKQAVRAAFAAAATRYDAVALVQRRIADALLSRCTNSTGVALDAGCGTGYAQSVLSRLVDDGCISLDQALPMLKTGTAAVCADIEALPLSSASVALYYSSLAWQWTNPRQAMAEAARVSRPGAQLAVATLGPDTLHELRAAFLRADENEHVRRFCGVDVYAPMAEAAGFTDVKIERMPFVSHAGDFRRVLMDIRSLGARVIGAPRSAGLFGVERYRRAEAWYESLRQREGLPVTYDAVLITARRKGQQ